MVWLHIKVEHNFKGLKENFVKVSTYTNTTCDLGVKKGERWIFYATRDESGNLSVGACSGTSKISGDDSEYLKNVAAVAQDKNIESINGFVQNERYSFTGVSDVIVNVEGINFFTTTTTNSQGFFTVRIPQAGKYQVRVAVPFAADVPIVPFGLEGGEMTEQTETKSVFSYEAIVPQGQCQYSELEFYPVDLKATAEIAGKFVATDGKQFPKFYPQLCRVKENEKETLSSCSMNFGLKQDGSFSFSGLREGKFVIVINSSNFPEANAPFLRHYYPGVGNFSDAGIINLEQGQKLNNLIFKLPPLLPTHEIKGQVFWKDKTPVSFSSDASYDEKLKIYLYNPQNGNSSLDVDYLKYWNDEKNEAEEVKMVEVKTDGTFSMLAFEGFEYILKAYIDKNGKTHCGFAKITVDKELTPLKISLNRTKKCSVEDYVNELK
ncbi:MAG TPA: hypothetical protein VFQ47_09450 [Nitrososphaera sp.]|nr:hypothetical protein [Nitrososphaera sp.]